MFNINVTDYQTITLLITAGTLLWSTSRQVHTLENISKRITDVEDDVEELKALYPLSPEAAVKCLHFHSGECKSIVHGV